MSPVESRPEPGPSERPCGICGLIDRCRRWDFPDFVAELPNSFVILGDAQFYRGYCVVLARAHVNEVHLMPPEKARALFEETVAVGRAIAAATEPLKINYECLGNVEPHVHWHVFPRFKADPMRSAPVWLRAEAERKVILQDADRNALVRAIGQHIKLQIASASLARPQ
jgi:diadenosine tetraphosphate (Ap4A) HIT family hydrolase